MSWTGSENQRKPQGICLPPANPVVKSARFTIPIGVSISVQKITTGNPPWRAHVTTKEQKFDQFEARSKGCYVFRAQGWMIRARYRDVKEWRGGQ
jgi:hypothetical protein